MNIFTIAFPERLAKYGALDFVRERLGLAPDLDNRNRCQRIGKYEFVIMQSRMVPFAVERGILTGVTGYDWLYDYTLGNPYTKLKIVEKLDFGKSEVVVFKGSDTQMKEPVTIITPYANLAKNISRKFGGMELVYVSGETEGMVKNRSVAQLGIDNKNSGNTISQTGLKIIDKLLDSYALTISKESDIDRVRKIWGLP